MNTQHDIYVGLQGASQLRDVVALVAKMVDGAHVSSGRGIWDGQQEPCARVTLIDTPERVVQTVAERLRDVFEQDCVMVTEAAVVMSFVYGAEPLPSCSGEAKGDGYPGTRFFHDNEDCPGHD
jgi:hypothetical protein